MTTVKIKKASGLLLRWMNHMGFRGWTSYWHTIYLHPDHMGDDSLIRHEMCHINQINSLGRFKFAIHYAYWHYKVGYWLNPMEIEARMAENKPPQNKQ